MLPKRLQYKLEQRQETNAYRELIPQNNTIDFSSNDYLGFTTSLGIFENANKYLIKYKILENGSTGSRLLTGNHDLFTDVEAMISRFHRSESALIFNSGYDANLGFFSAVPQRNDIILFDELCHASIRDGIMLSHAQAFKYKHNDFADLEVLLNRYNKIDNDIYIVSESVFSMDGDTPDLVQLSKISKAHKAYLILDEAHATGIFGSSGRGLVCHHNLEHDVFARIITFGKALGAHGAAILSSNELKEYLINFSRPFIYTTGLPPHSVATIMSSYDALQSEGHTNSSIAKLHSNIQFFKSELLRLNLQNKFIASDSAIQCCIISGNEKTKYVAQQLQNNGFNVKPILSPTVSLGNERLRFCIHAFNSQKEISEVLHLLTTFAI